MDLNKLIGDINPYGCILENQTVVNCIEYCLNTDELIFLTNCIGKEFT